jgi:hypothetical protein
VLFAGCSGSPSSREVPFTLVSAEGRTLRLTVEAGGPPCDGVREVAVHETRSTVTVTVTTGPEPRANCGSGATLLLGTLPAAARLREPLGERKLLDGAR